jgi:hypothetical protein
MNCPNCRKGWIDIDVAGEVEHDLCPDCNGTGVAPVPASPIRDSAGKLCITPGVWHSYVDFPHATVWTDDHHFIASVSDAESSDCALIAEAGTVTNQTGRTPAELVALVRELREALNAACDMANTCVFDDILAKTEGI